MTHSFFVYVECPDELTGEEIERIKFILGKRTSRMIVETLGERDKEVKVSADFNETLPE